MAGMGDARSPIPARIVLKDPHRDSAKRARREEARPFLAAFSSPLPAKPSSDYSDAGDFSPVC